MLTRTSIKMHGIERRYGDGIWWHQYYVGVFHTWYFYGVPVWWRFRKRDRPMHEFIKRATGC